MSKIQGSLWDNTMAIGLGLNREDLRPQAERHVGTTQFRWRSCEWLSADPARKRAR
jgi:hypothetical protein